MRWLNKHARKRDRLSSYLDGALAPSEQRAMEAHLSACGACRVELEQLRAIVASARELPQVDVPRSFAVTPQMLQGRRPVASAPSAPTLALGMRLASAGVAVLLAVVVIGDLSDAGGGSQSAEFADEARTTADLAAQEMPAEGESGAAAPVPETNESAEQYELEAPARDAGEVDAGATAACPAAAAAPTEPTSGGGAGGVGGSGASPAATPVPQPPATAPPGLGAEQADPACPAQPPVLPVEPTTPAAEPAPADDAAEEGFSKEPAAEAEDDGGLSTLRILEIALAGSLVVLLGGIAVELALRRRRAV